MIEKDTNKEEFKNLFNNFITYLEQQTTKTFEQLISKSKDRKDSNAVCLLMIIRYTKSELLSFDHIIGAYAAITLDAQYDDLVLELAEKKASNIQEVMWIYAMSSDLDQKNRLWETAQKIANSFDDYKEMYEQTEEGSPHNLKAFNLLGINANIVDDRDYISKKRIKIIKYQRQLIN
jgi:hypothetical protein